MVGTGTGTGERGLERQTHQSFNVFVLLITGIIFPSR
jgi:hypothetical protein